MNLQALGERGHLLLTEAESKAEADEWVQTPAPAFWGRTPISLIRGGRLDHVVEVLATMESGAFL
jgi:hypothetical protein